jgi:hypothetical protein
MQLLVMNDGACVSYVRETIINRPLSIGRCWAMKWGKKADAKEFIYPQKWGTKDPFPVENEVCDNQIISDKCSESQYDRTAY